ncbi:MAG: TolC family protein [Verrucomicrobiota bacterium]
MPNLYAQNAESTEPAETPPPVEESVVIETAAPEELPAATPAVTEPPGAPTAPNLPPAVAAGPENLDDAVRMLRQNLGTDEGETEAVEPENVPEDRPIGQRRIAVVFDGPGPAFDAQFALIKQELAQLVPDSSRYRFVQKPEFNGNWTFEGVEKALQNALRDRDIDMVLVFGLISTAVASDPDTKLVKPVLSSSLQTTDIFGADVNADGSAVKENFSFILLPGGLSTDLDTFQDMMQFDRVAIIVDAATFKAISDNTEVVENLLERLPYKVTFLPAEGSPDAIAANARAVSPRGVVVGQMPRLDAEEREALYAALNRQGVATFSLAGREDVEMGALAALYPESDDIVARRVALNLNQLLIGMTTADLPVYIALQQQLVINARTANQIGFSPSFRILMVANVLFDDELDRGKPLTINAAIKMAAVNNVDLVVARAQTDLSEALKNIDRSFLLPQVFSDLTYFHVDGETVRLSQGTTPETQLSTGIAVRQVIFNDELMSNFFASRNLFLSQKLQYESVRLDVMELGALAFIDLLAAESLLRIEIDNLRLTQTNLQIARIRFQVGDTDPSETLRWESEEAQGRSAVFEREADVGIAMATLNQVLGVPGHTRWAAQDIILPDGDMYFLANGIKDFVTNPEQLERFREYSVFLALGNSPSLRAIDEEIGAERIQLGQAKRSFFLPEIEAGFDVDHVLDANVQSGVDQADVIVRTPWQAQIVATLPLFEGGRRFAEVEQNKSELDIVVGNWITAAQFVELDTRVAIRGIEGSFPSIELSRRSRAAAEENLKLVLQKYQEGAVSIIDLIDAQNQSFQEQQRAALAVYDYLADLYNYQRSISWFELGKTDQQESLWLQNLANGMRQMGRVKARNDQTGTRAAARAQGIEP